MEMEEAEFKPHFGARQLYDQSPIPESYELSDETVESGEDGPRWHFGEDVWMETGGEDSTHIPLAEDVWPIERYHHIDDEEVGVRLIYRPHPDGELEAALCPHGAWTSKSQARRQAAGLGSEGVRIRSGQGDEFVLALGAWLEQTDDVKQVRLTRTPGWHEECESYCNGDQVYAPDEQQWYADTTTTLIERRSTRCGSTIQWVDHVDRLATTPGLVAALGVSLAGPLVELIHPGSFLVHFYGPSSTGKSTALELGSSIWGHPETIRNSWNNTVNALEALAVIADGACLTLDELGQFSGGDERLANAIYNLASQQGRNRATQTGDLQEQRHWALTGLSTGEISMKDRVGSHRKGGQDVRMLDVPVEQGDLTDDADHAEAVKEAVGLAATGGHYGRPGDRWVRWLQQERPIVEASTRRDDLQDALVDEFGDGAETARMLSHCALVGAALELAGEVGIGGDELVPVSDETARHAVWWLAGKCTGDREETTPNERALQLWWQKIETEPGHFPQERDVEQGNHHGSIWGLMGSGGQFYTSESHIKKSGLPSEAGVGIRAFLHWAVDEGHARRESSRTRRGGRRCRWYIFQRDRNE